MAGYIKFDDILGESRDKDHENWCDLIVFDQLLERSARTGATNSALRLSADPFKIVKRFDAASGPLLDRLAANNDIKKVTVDFTRNYSDANVGRQTYLQITMSSVRVLSYHVSGQSDGDVCPTEEISLGYASIEFAYTPADKEGNPKANISTDITLELENE